MNSAIQALHHDEVYQHRVDELYTHHIEPHTQRLILCGAGHVGRALVRVLANTPLSIHWLDERADEFPQEVPGNAHIEVTDTATAVVSQAPAGSAVLITTHRHDLDFELAATAIETPHIAYCGLIGSSSKRARFERQWRQRQTNDEQNDNALARLICPIGGTELSGKEPEVIAIAVAYEILAALQAWQEANQH